LFSRKLLFNTCENIKIYLKFFWSELTLQYLILPIFVMGFSKYVSKRFEAHTVASPIFSSWRFLCSICVKAIPKYRSNRGSFYSLREIDDWVTYRSHSRSSTRLICCHDCASCGPACDAICVGSGYMVYSRVGAWFIQFFLPSFASIFILLFPSRCDSTTFPVFFYFKVLCRWQVVPKTRD